MRLHVFLSSALFPAILLQDAVCTDCPDGWLAFSGSCYLFGHNDLHFTEAEKFCEKLDSHLVYIDSQTENIFIQSFLSDIKDLNHWIGLTDEVIEGLWKWQETDFPVTFTDWYPGQPDEHRAANCVMIGSLYKYQWLDTQCTNAAVKPICEKDHREVEVVG